MSEWVSVKRRMPEDDEYVLVAITGMKSYGYERYVRMDFRRDGRWVSAFDEPIEVVTHWMPLPEPPKED